MTQQTELEKTQLEIAKLQLEQERRKLAGMQRRSEAVGSLGRGVKNVLGVGVALVLLLAMGAVLGVLGAGMAINMLGLSNCGATYPGADALYLIGCAYGQNQALTTAAAAIGAVWFTIYVCIGQGKPNQ